MTLLAMAVLLAALAAGWVIYPILSRQLGLTDAIPSHRVDSETRKRVALAALKDAEYDHAAGKLDDADYHEMRGRLEREALDALQTVQRSATGTAGPVAGSVAAHACGFANPAGSRFCAGCGSPLG